MNDFILLKQKSLYSSKTDESGYQLSKVFWLFGYILNGNYYFKMSLFTVWHKCHGLLLKFKNLSGVSLVAQKLKNLPAKQETRCQSLGQEPGEGNGNPFQYSCLEKSIDGGTWRATVHKVTKSQTRLSN